MFLEISVSHLHLVVAAVNFVVVQSCRYVGEHFVVFLVESSEYP